MSSSATSPRRFVDTGFLRERMASLLAVVPLGIWTVNHLWNNLGAFSGAATWQAQVTEYPHPIAFFVSSIVALLPLGLHTVWGIARLASTRPNLQRYTYFANLRYVLQRIAAVGVLFFVGAHLWLAMLKPRLETGRPEPFADIAHEMSHHTPTLLVYVFGTLGVAYHLANGLLTFTMGFGVVTSKSTMRKLVGPTIAVFLLLLGLSWSAIYALWDAGSRATTAESAP
jgi:succinate dehydrogenase / fumarate reductase cytochrome b subunit